jgi:hypothetical protein
LTNTQNQNAITQRPTTLQDEQIETVELGTRDLALEAGLLQVKDNLDRYLGAAYMGRTLIHSYANAQPIDTMLHSRYSVKQIQVIVAIYYHGMKHLK